MTSYIYNDEDNAPMSDFDHDGHNPTVYLDAWQEKMCEKYGNKLVPAEHADGCWNCLNFDWKHEACTLNWNNLDESYYNPDTDNRELTDHCDEWEEDPDADPECLNFGGNEP